MTEKDKQRLDVVCMQLQELKLMLPLKMDTAEGSKVIADVKTLLDKTTNHVKQKQR